MESQPQRVFVTDCEGPITRNDNAAEVCEAFIPDGHRLFSRVSLYDDYLAEVVKREGYKAGDTLRLILPFLKAFGVDDETVAKFSRRNIDIIPLADRALSRIAEQAPAYLVSTSYCPYIQAVCEAVGFPLRNAFCTQLRLDRYDLIASEKQKVRDLASRILQLPDFTIPEQAGSLDDLTPADRGAVLQLEEIFWNELPAMAIGRIMEEVNPVGGSEKAEAVKKIASSHGMELARIMYVGDSITDVEAFRLVNRGGGVTVSFNGNAWAVREASYAVVARHALPLEWLAELFFTQGAAGLEDLLLTQASEQGRDELIASSSRIRKEVRTEKIGSLG